MTKCELQKAITDRIAWRIENSDTETNEGMLEAVMNAFTAEMARLEKRIEELEVANADIRR
jgi:hypothetical protein